MADIQYTAESLKEMIKALEIKQAEEGQELKEELIDTYENLKPSNILKNVVREFYSSEHLKDELISTAISVASGFISKKLVVGKSRNQILKLVGLAVQLGITTFISKKMEVLKEAAINFINRFVGEKEESWDEEVKG
jgi:hypothetical protein